MGTTVTPGSVSSGPVELPQEELGPVGRGAEEEPKEGVGPASGTGYAAESVYEGPATAGTEGDDGITGTSPNPASGTSPQTIAKASQARQKAVHPIDAKPLLERASNSQLFSLSEAIPNAEIPPYAAWQGAAPLVKQLLDANAFFFSGIQGLTRAARFVDSDRRGDYDFSHAYGRETYRLWTQGEELIASIPPGSLAQHLTVETATELFKRIYDPSVEKPLVRASILGRDLLTGQRWADSAFRSMRAIGYVDGPYTDEQVTNIEAAGCGFVETSGSKPNARRGKVRFGEKDPQKIEARLAAIFADTRAALEDPETDPFLLCADFIRRYVALHPFKEANGRTARLWGDAILAHYGILPPLLDNLNEDLTSSNEALAAKIAAGSARTARCLGLRFEAGSHPPEASAPWQAVLEGASAVTSPYPRLPEVEPFMIQNAGPLSYLVRLFAVGDRSAPQRLPPVIESPTSTPIYVAGSRLAQGPDGFVYNDKGRPHLLGEDGALTPIRDTAYIDLMPFVALGPEPEAMLRQLTGPTRQAFARLVDEPGSRAKTKVADDRAAIAGEHQLATGFPSSVIDTVLAIVDPDRIGAKRLFAPDIQEATVLHPVGFILSQYQQLDLALYRIERGLKKGGSAAAREEIRAHRTRLFSLARAELAKAEGAVPGTGPGAAVEAWRQRATEASPLRYETFADYLANEDDDELILWRGDFALGRYLGTHPDVNPMADDVLAVGKRLGKDTSQRLFVSMERHIAQGEGSPWISFTSTPEIMDFAHKEKVDAYGQPIFGYAGRAAQKDVELIHLPALLRRSLMATLRVGKTTRIKDPFGDNNLLIVERISEKTVRITAERRAFAYRIPKATACLNPPNLFSWEQQILVGASASPFQIVESWSGAAVDRGRPIPP